MAWENPVTTWGQAGKTVPGAGDFNRIEGNTQYLKDEVDLHKEDETAHITPDERNDWNSKAAGSHNHDASDINTGTLPVARGGTGGTTAATARNNLGVAQTRVYNGKLQYYDGGWKDLGGIKALIPSNNLKHTLIGSTPKTISTNDVRKIGQLFCFSSGVIKLSFEAQSSNAYGRGSFNIVKLLNDGTSSIGLPAIIQAPLDAVVDTSDGFNMKVAGEFTPGYSLYEHTVRVGIGDVLVFTFHGYSNDSPSIRNLKIFYDVRTDDTISTTV